MFAKQNAHSLIKISLIDWECINCCTNLIVTVTTDDLTHDTNVAHNWQNLKRVFLSCHRHEIYRVKTVGLKIQLYF